MSRLAKQLITPTLSFTIWITLLRYLYHCHHVSPTQSSPVTFLCSFPIDCANSLILSIPSCPPNTDVHPEAQHSSTTSTAAKSRKHPPQWSQTLPSWLIQLSPSRLRHVHFHLIPFFLKSDETFTQDVLRNTLGFGRTRFKHSTTTTGQSSVVCRERNQGRHPYTGAPTFSEPHSDVKSYVNNPTLHCFIAHVFLRFSRPRNTSLLSRSVTPI